MKPDQLFETHTFPAGQYVFREGEVGNAAYLIKSGTVEVCITRNNKDVHLAFLRPGQIFGEIALIRGDHRTASVRVTAEAQLVVVDRKTFDVKLQNSDPTVRAITRMLTERIAETNRATAKSKRHVDNMFDVFSTFYNLVRESLPQIEKQFEDEGDHERLQSLKDIQVRLQNMLTSD